MEEFFEGKVVKTFITKKGRTATIRYPAFQDVDALLAYINPLSAEDTYITLSGEQLTREEEEKFLHEMISGIKSGNKVFLLCEFDGKIIGSCDIVRDETGKKRTHHVGIFGIAIAKDYRGEGIGRALMVTTIDEAKKHIQGLRIITMKLYSENEVGRRLYESLGFVETGRLHQGILFHGRYIENIWMAKRIG